MPEVPKKRRWIYFFAVALFVFALDLGTKRIVERNLTLSSEIRVTSFFNIVHVRNRGTIFGLFSDVESELFRKVLNTVSVAVMLFLVYFSAFFSGFPFYVMGAMLGGAAGNVWERITKGYVTDFLDFHIGGYHWPAFNIADTAITLGMITIILSSFFPQKAKAKSEK